MIFYSQCKINIGLRVLSRREDGFHNIESLFYPVEGLSDAIEILPSDSPGQVVEFSSSGLEVDCHPDRNLCVRACKAMQQRYDLPSIKLHLHKVAPMGAGLGGGSSDCATTIKGINRLFALNLDSETMREIGASLGSDVPFFIDGTAAWVSGRGERLENADFSLRGMHLVIVKPDIHIPTAWAYSKIRPYESESPLKQLLNLPMDRWAECVKNDFEPAVFGEYPLIGDIKNRMYAAGAKFALMSGSGASVFGLFDENPASRLTLDPQWFVYYSLF